jgi:hypothetical protein
MLIAMLACALPGRGSPQEPAPVSGSIETAIAGTAQAASQQTAEASLVTATPAGMTGTTIDQLADGTTKYTDYDAGFEITFPAGWLTVRANSEEFNASLVGEATANSMLHDQMAADLTSYEADHDRLYSYILHPDIKKNVLFGFSKTKWDQNDSTVLDNANMGKLVRDLEAQTTLPGFRVDTAQIHDEGSTRVIEVGGRWNFNDGTSEPVPFYSVFFFFKPIWTSTVRVSITFVQDYQDEFKADVKSIMDSIKLSDQ